jgi:hypothetical protein
VQCVFNSHIDVVFGEFARKAHLSREENSLVHSRKGHEHIHLLDVCGKAAEVLITGCTIDQDLPVNVPSSLPVGQNV